jgi:hypothetical protein
MAPASKGLFEEEIGQALLEALPDSDPGNSSSGDGSSGTDNLAVGEVIALECSVDESDIMQVPATPSAPSSSSATFMWKDMTKYVGQREQFVANCGPQSETQNETHCPKVFKMFSTGELVELIVHETNTSAEQKYEVDISFHYIPGCETGTLSLKMKCML